MAEGEFEGLTRDEAEALIGNMLKGYRRYAPDWPDTVNKWRWFHLLWQGETIEQCLADKENFLAQSMKRGSKRIPIKVLLAKYVCRSCGANLLAFEFGSVWGVLCQRDPLHAGLERALLYEGKRGLAEMECRREEAIKGEKANPCDPEEIHQAFRRDFYGEEERC